MDHKKLRYSGNEPFRDCYVYYATEQHTNPKILLYHYITPAEL